MSRKCSSPGCAMRLPDKYPLAKCPWHLAPGRGPVKIAAAVAIAAAGFGGGMAYKKFKAYLRGKDKERNAKQKKPAPTHGEQQAAPVVGKPRAPRLQKQPRARKKSAAKSKRKPAKSAVSQGTRVVGS